LRVNDIILEMDLESIVPAARETLNGLRNQLLSMREPAGYWAGELSASALSTATAISALATVRRSLGDANVSAHGDQIDSLVARGIVYLDSQQNADGGYGDTDRSYSNIATSYLVFAARTLANNSHGQDRLRAYLRSAGEFAGLRRRYGKDKTFVVPILTNLAIAGLADWSTIPRLPFEAAVFPGAMYRFLQMPVVSYAIPALVAIGQAHHFLGPKTFWPIRRVRAAAVEPTLRVLQRMQPQSGGYLEATPLTSFVLMSLAASGRASHPVALRCIDFLRASIRKDGSWPIDTNLATWVTSLAVHALGEDPDDDGRWATPELIAWHLSCQHSRRHPFTGAAPGGWGWTDLSGAVPDGDDTPGAILAARRFMTRTAERDGGRCEVEPAASDATKRGLTWLVDLQNRDGGLPTFCRGWGKLPFDRSSTDLTAHMIRAIDAVGCCASAPGVPGPAETIAFVRRLRRARQNAVKFLRRQQRDNGCWVPLWFGNQDEPEEENPIYGTSRVLLAIAGDASIAGPRERAVDYLISRQNADGGWGGGASLASWILRKNRQWGDDSKTEDVSTEGVVVSCRSSLEETAVAVEAIACVMRARCESGEISSSPRDRRCTEAIIGGVRFIVGAVALGQHHEPWPIGFYFAKLWYHERLYPIVLTMAALGATLRLSTIGRPDESG
jgi:squalene-hopene/tetraprenyl-beta-curcumene cyclase